MPFSYSQLSTYRTCPKQFEFANVKKIPRQISAGESFGSSVHNTLKKWGEVELENAPAKEDIGQLTLFMDDDTSLKQTDLTLELLVELWHSSFITEGYESKDDADSARQKGEKIMQHFYNWWSTKQREVVAIETGFKWESPDNFIVSGRFDRIEKTAEGLHVIDFKTGSLREQESVNTDLQLSIYALASTEVFQLPCSKLTLLFLKEDGVTEVTTTRNSQQLETAIQEMDSLVEGIDLEEFEATPSERICKRCPYRGICDASAV